MSSLNLANVDCYKNKVKLGTKGAEELGNLLRHPMCLISHLDLTDNALTTDALSHIITGVKTCKSLVSLNLSQNDMGQSNSVFNQLLSIFRTGDSDLQELNLSDSQLTDKHLEEMANVFKQDRKLNLSILNLSANSKCKPSAFAHIIASLANNSQVPISRLILNNNDLEVSKKTNSTAFF